MTLLSTVLALGSAPAADADWVPEAVPQAARFTLVGTVAETYVSSFSTGWYRLDPVSYASPSAAPYVADGEVTVQEEKAIFSGDIDYWINYASQVGNEVRMYGWLVPDPAAPDGATFQLDGGEPASWPEQDPMGPPDPDLVARTVDARKSTLAWTGHECEMLQDDWCEGEVIGPDFAGDDLRLTIYYYTEDNWPAPTPNDTYVQIALEISDGAGSLLKVVVSGWEKPFQPASVLQGGVSQATGKYAGLVGGAGVLGYTWPGYSGQVGAGVGELLVYPPAG